MSKPKKQMHLRVVRNEVTKAPPLPQENAPSIVIEVTDGMLVTCEGDTRIEDCGELLKGILTGQAAILRKMKGA